MSGKRFTEVKEDGYNDPMYKPPEGGKSCKMIQQFCRLNRDDQ